MKYLMCLIRERIVAVGAIAWVLCFFAPLDFLFSNIDDLWLDVYNVIGGIGLVTLSVFVVLLILNVIVAIIPHIGIRAGRIQKFIQYFILFAFYVQGNFIAVPYGALNGNPIEWNAYTVENVSSVFTWIGILAVLCVTLYKWKWEKFDRIMTSICICICLITAFTLIVEVAQGGTRKKTYKMSSTQNEWKYSTEKNINILLLDAFDSRLLTDAFQDDGICDLLRDFDGFTYYQDTLGCYNLTDYSIPVILTGNMYLGESTYGDYINSAYSKSPMFNRLFQENWNTNLYTTITLPQGEVSNHFDNIRLMHMGPIYRKKLIVDFYSIVGFRYFPTPMKRYFYQSFFEVGANRCVEEVFDSDESDGTVVGYDWNNMIWSNGTKMDWELTDDSMFHFYHVMGVHAPRQYNSDFQFVLNPEDVTLQEGAKFNLKMVDIWLNRLKMEGVYDNSVIIICADHGSVEYDDGYHLSQNPLLLVKGYDEHHDFQVSNTPVSYLDIQSVIANLMNGDDSVCAFKNVQTAYGLDDEKYCQIMNIEQCLEYNSTNFECIPVGRYRLFYFIYLMNEMGVDSVGGPFYEGLTEYPAYFPEKMIKTGNEY